MSAKPPPWPDRGSTIMSQEADDWLLLGTWVIYGLILIAILVVGCTLVTRPEPPSPTPRETPWVWLAPSPVGGGCVVFGDQLGTCFTVEAP